MCGVGFDLRVHVNVQVCVCVCACVHACACVCVCVSVCVNSQCGVTCTVWYIGEAVCEQCVCFGVSAFMIAQVLCTNLRQYTLRTWSRGLLFLETLSTC